ncbi:lytic murein transglycosylase [Agrobacterium vitis]|nr:lytic murein transglycosylase [Agrobacterium vitis]
MSRALACAVTPLCPAGHLPLKGGDHKGIIHLSQLPFRGFRAPNFFGYRPQSMIILPISPLEGEMPGKAEGGMRSTRGATP